MKEEFESFVNSQLKTMKTHMDLLTEYLREYEERSIKLKKIISYELIAALIKRFEENENRMREISEKLDSSHLKLQEQLTREMRNLRQEMSETELSKSITKIFEEKEIRVSSKPLEELEKSY
jgi:hypothetical protein